MAALLVFWHHAQEIFEFHLFDVAAISAVDLFLVLSGFVMARTYEARMRTAGLTSLRFMVIRYRRLWAPMAIGSLIGVVAAVQKSGFEAGLLPAFAMILLFMPFHFGGGVYTLNYPAWSLFGEVLANLLHVSLFARSQLVSVAIWFGATLIFVGATMMMGVIPWAREWFGLAIGAMRGLSCYLVGVMIFRQWGDTPLLIPGAVPAFPLLLIVGAHFAPLAFSIGFALVGAPLLLRAALAFPVSRVASVAGALSFPLYAVHVPVLKLVHGLGGSAGTGILLTLAIAWLITILTTPPRLPEAVAMA